MDPDPKNDPLARANGLYARVLSQWAIDLLQLRRSGLDVPSVRSARTDLLSPSPSAMPFTPWLPGPPELATRWKAA